MTMQKIPSVCLPSAQEDVTHFVKEHVRDALTADFSDLCLGDIQYRTVDVFFIKDQNTIIEARFFQTFEGYAGPREHVLRIRTRYIMKPIEDPVIAVMPFKSVGDAIDAIDSLDIKMENLRGIYAREVSTEIKPSMTAQDWANEVKRIAEGSYDSRDPEIDFNFELFKDGACVYTYDAMMFNGVDPEVPAKEQSGGILKCRSEVFRIVFGQLHFRLFLQQHDAFMNAIRGSIVKEV